MRRTPDRSWVLNARPASFRLALTFAVPKLFRCPNRTRAEIKPRVEQGIGGLVWPYLRFVAHFNIQKSGFAYIDLPERARHSASNDCPADLNASAQAGGFAVLFGCACMDAIRDP